MLLLDHIASYPHTSVSIISHHIISHTSVISYIIYHIHIISPCICYIISYNIPIYLLYHIASYIIYHISYPHVSVRSYPHVSVHQAPRVSAARSCTSPTAAVSPASVRCCGTCGPAQPSVRAHTPRPVVAGKAEAAKAKRAKKKQKKKARWMLDKFSE